MTFDELKQAKLENFRLKNADSDGAIKYIVTLLLRDGVSFTNQYAIQSRLEKWRIASVWLYHSQITGAELSLLMTHVAELNRSLIAITDTMREIQKRKTTEENTNGNKKTKLE